MNDDIICENCTLTNKDHTDGKCLYAATLYRPAICPTCQRPVAQEYDHNRDVAYPPIRQHGKFIHLACYWHLP